MFLKRTLFGLCLITTACGAGRDGDKKSNFSLAIPEDLQCLPENSSRCEDYYKQSLYHISMRDSYLAAKDYFSAAHHAALVKKNHLFIGYLRSNKPNGETEKGLESLSNNIESLLKKPNLEGESEITCDDHECSAALKDLNKLAEDLKKAKGENGFGYFALSVHYNFVLKKIQHQDDKPQEDAARSYDFALAIVDEMRTVSRSNGHASLLCPVDLALKCDAVAVEVESLRQERERHLKSRSRDNLNRLNLRISYLSEVLSAYRAGFNDSSKEVLAIRKKFDALSQLLFSSSSDRLGMTPYTDGERAAVEEVFRDFGPLYIKETVDPETGKPAAREVVAKGEMPWSGYWYPKREDQLFAGEDSPLSKFDTLLKKLERTSGAAAWEKERFTTIEADWAGLCDAWATASVLTDEPKRSVVKNGVEFSVSDLKALILKKYEGHQPLIYGRRNFGTYASNGEHQDIRPEAFHKLVESVIGEQQRAIAVDEDPSPEVWNKPLFKMRWTVSKDPQHQDAYLVKAFPRLVAHRLHVSDDLTNEFDMRAPVYEYRLYVDQKDQNDQGYRVIYGEWINESRDDHPDMVYLLDHNQKIQPHNPVVAENLDVLDELLSY